MAYFSNGSEGSDYEERYCAKCVHWNNQDGCMCPIWHAHFLYAYDMANKTEAGKQILDLLIPMNGTAPGKCSTFMTVETRSRKRAQHKEQLKMFDGKASGR